MNLIWLMPSFGLAISGHQDCLLKYLLYSLRMDSAIGFSRCVDVVVLNNRNEVSAIEFKKEKWKEAIDQALRVSTSFDFLEICILSPAHDELKKEIVACCREQGIGVYFMNPTTMKVKKVLQSRKNPSIWKAQKKDVINYLEAERNG